MNLVNSTNHPNDHNFSDDDLYALTPVQIKKYLCLLAYGKEDPDIDVDLPTACRSSNLEFAKKAISSFMPNRNMTWNNQSNQGNPTRASELNDLIKTVKKREVRKQGKASCTRRPMEIGEFRQLIKEIRYPGGGRSEYTHKYALAAYFIFQFHMIARVDDVMHFKCNDLTPNLEFDFALKSKMCWSKNLLDERSTTDQIILGAADSDFCTLLALAIHLEINIANGTIGADDPDATLMGISKTLASKQLRAIVESDYFERAADGPLGSHSTRKFAATFARRNGCGKDDVDARGRWKGQKRMVDTYIDGCLPYPDAKTASSLCVGGAVKYALRRSSRVSDDWLLENVSSNIARVFPRPVAVVLGKALLWAICDEEASTLVDTTMVERVRSAVRSLNGCYNQETGMNPVVKIPLAVSGEEGVLIIDELIDENDIDDENEEGDEMEIDGQQIRRRNTNGGRSSHYNGRNDSRNEVRALVTSVKQLTRQNTELKNELHLFKHTCTTLLQQLNTSVRRIAINPSIRSQGRLRGSTNTNSTIINIDSFNSSSSPSRQESTVQQPQQSPSRNAIPYELTLVKCPKTLFVLWNEWEFGVGGRKAAKMFSSRERGHKQVKFSYCLRKHFWDLVSKMILRGHSHTAAIDKIYEVYGSNLSATKILRLIRTDSKLGGHPQLR